jgi:hypothetical protein
MFKRIEVVKRDCTGIAPAYPGDHSQQGGLARPVDAYKAENRPFFHFEIQILNHLF